MSRLWNKSVFGFLQSRTTNTYRIHKYWSYKRENWSNTWWLAKYVGSMQAQKEDWVLSLKWIGSPQVESISRGKKATTVFRQNLRQNITGLLLFRHVLAIKTSGCASSNSSLILVAIHLFCLILRSVTWLCLPTYQLAHVSSTLSFVFTMSFLHYK